MKLRVTIITIAAFFASAEACQCISSDGVNVAATQNCCHRAGGTADGNQCPAGQISQKLSTFASCCQDYGDRSDCRCPSGCARAELEAMYQAQGKAPPTENEINALLATYAD